MSLYEYFRRVMGFPNQRPPIDPMAPDINDPTFRNPIWAGADDDDDDDDDELIEYRSSSPFSFRMFSGDPFEMHKYFEEQLEEMMRSFKHFGSDLLDIPVGAQDEGMFLKDKEESDVRSQYLKPSFERRLEEAPKRDSDIDNKYFNSKIIDLFPDGNNMQMDVPHRVFGKSVITRTVTLPDGSLEHHKKIKTSDGEEKWTVTRKLGDKVHTVITHKNASGITEKQEEFVNMDEENLGEFNDKWQLNKNGTTPAVILPEDHFTEGDHRITKLFEKWFLK